MMVSIEGVPEAVNMPDLVTTPDAVTASMLGVPDAPDSATVTAIQPTSPF